MSLKVWSLGLGKYGVAGVSGGLKAEKVDHPGAVGVEKTVRDACCYSVTGLVMALGMAGAAVAGTNVVPASVARVFAVAADRHSLNEVTFTSKAAIVRFTGRTSKVSGDATINVQDASKAVGLVKVDLASLDTGISLRNEHMRGVLETEKFPVASFSFAGIKLAQKALTPNAPVLGTARGQMTLHGVTRVIDAPVELTYLPEEDANYRPGDWIHVNAHFRIKMSDYGIQLPKPVLGIKVSDDIELDIDGMAAAEKSENKAPVGSH